VQNMFTIDLVFTFSLSCFRLKSEDRQRQSVNGRSTVSYWTTAKNSPYQTA
jgi:hypothetical protein